MDFAVMLRACSSDSVNRSIKWRLEDADECGSIAKNLEKIGQYQ